MDVFSEEILNKMFKCYNEDEPYKLLSRESSTLEFKQSFSKQAICKYGKTMASYANKEGGYIVFGVKNNPRTVIGLKDNYFDEFDDEKFVEKLNEFFSPEIRFEREFRKYKDLNIGIIYVYPSTAKPVVCTKNFSIGDKILFKGRGYIL